MVKLMLRRLGVFSHFSFRIESSFHSLLLIIVPTAYFVGLVTNFLRYCGSSCNSWCKRIYTHSVSYNIKDVRALSNRKDDFPELEQFNEIFHSNHLTSYDSI